MAGNDSPKVASRPRPHQVTDTFRRLHTCSSTSERQTMSNTPPINWAAGDADYGAGVDSFRVMAGAHLAGLPRYRPTFSDLKSENPAPGL
ncbi:hypothetical protein D3C84_1148370 [compost metagenome]